MSLRLGKWVLLGAPAPPEGQAGLMSPEHGQLAQKSWRACSGLPSLPSARTAGHILPTGDGTPAWPLGSSKAGEGVRGSPVGLGGVRRNLWARSEMGVWMTRLQEEAGRPFPHVPAGTGVRCGGEGAVWTGTGGSVPGPPPSSWHSQQESSVSG